MLIPKLPPRHFRRSASLAAVGAVWGSIKALAQVRVPLLLAHAGLALYSVLWWHLAQVGKLTPHSMLYVSALTLALGGLTFGWDRLRVRYGDLDLNQIGGLFKPMPRFALCMGLLVMAVGDCRRLLCSSAIWLCCLARRRRCRQAWLPSSQPGSPRPGTCSD